MATTTEKIVALSKQTSLPKMLPKEYWKKTYYVYFDQGGLFGVGSVTAFCGSPIPKSKRDENETFMGVMTYEGLETLLASSILAHGVVPKDSDWSPIPAARLALWSIANGGM